MRNTVAISSCLLLALGCATPIGVRHVSEEKVHETLAESAMSTGHASALSRQVLLREGLYERYEDEPEAVLQQLHERVKAEMDPATLFALAEYSELFAEAEERHEYHMASALYAYAYLFPEDGGSPDPLDPRRRTAADLYNSSLADALVDVGGPGGTAKLALPPHVGTLSLRFDQAALTWAGRDLHGFEPASGLELRGLRNRYRRAGIGAAFAARARAPAGTHLTEADALIGGEHLRIPVSFFLRLSAPRAALRSGAVEGALELYDASTRDAVEISGQEVPIEYEPSVALALTLDKSPVWDTEIAGFRRSTLKGGSILRLLSPHQAGRIPVVFVHGTASSPARWAEMLNELQSDDVLRRHFEFWFFQYPTGNAILYSADLLRQKLASVLAVLDPSGSDAALSRMVLIGHSQGGLLCKLQVIDAGDRFWKNVSDKPFESLTLEPETHTLLENAMFVKPSPYVSRVIFISTPQRGALMAGNFLGRFASRLTQAPSTLAMVGVDLLRAGIQLPGQAVDLARQGVDAATGDEEAQALHKLARMPSSVDNMNASAPFVKTISAIRVEPPVIAHSIIPVKGGPPPAGQHDGVVAYDSAHIDEAESEFVVFHQNHSAQGNPLAIQEVRRILLEHLAASK